MKNPFLNLLITLGVMALFVSSLGFPSGYAPDYVASVRTLYSPTPIGTASPVPIQTKLPANCSQVDIFDSSGQTLELMTGPAGSERRVRIIPPGGTGLVGQWLPQGARVSLRSLSATASAGENDFTCLAE